MPLLLRINISDQQLQFYISWKKAQDSILYITKRSDKMLFLTAQNEINKNKEQPELTTVGNLAMQKQKKSQQTP